MPSSSKAQDRFMRAVASGAIKATGLTKQKAAEFTQHDTPQSFSKLPERVGPKERFSRLSKHMKGKK